jgi:hypothetical protein
VYKSDSLYTHAFIHKTRTVFQTLRLSMLRGKPSTKNLRPEERAMAALRVCVCVMSQGVGGIDQYVYMRRAA